MGILSERDANRILHLLQSDLQRGRGSDCAVRAPRFLLSPAPTADAFSCARSDLYNNQLSGIIPSSLGSLTGLVQLCVWRINCRRAPRPRALRRMHVLAVLFVPPTRLSDMVTMLAWFSTIRFVAVLFVTSL